MADVSILVRCFERNEFTEHPLASIQATATSRFELICRPNRAKPRVRYRQLEPITRSSTE